MDKEQAPHVEGELSLREVQLASLEILKLIDEICQREGIRYWLTYGSLLGAVRHQGFIPWDDDLDIAMPRPDYERFLTYFANHLGELRPLVAVHTTRERKLPFLITRVSNTAYRMIGEYGDGIPELGTFVDVYPIDGCGDDRDGAFALRERCNENVMRYLQAEDFSYYNRGNNGVKRALKKVHASMLGNSDRYMRELSDAISANAYESSKYLGCLVWPCDDESLCTHSSVDVLKRVKFEDIDVPIPSGYEQILTEQYGDYMSLPSEGERVGHHFYAIVTRDESTTWHG